jgi:hypothetical protein
MAPTAGRGTVANENREVASGACRARRLDAPETCPRPPADAQQVDNVYSAADAWLPSRRGIATNPDDDPISTVYGKSGLKVTVG